MEVLDVLYNMPGLPEVEQYLLEQEQVNCPVYHHFSPGIYMREVNLPADTVAMGHVQKTEHMNIIVKGRVTLMDPVDGSLKEVEAPMTFVGKPGSRKFGYIHEDTVWINVFPTTETDIDTLEKILFEKSDIFGAKQLQQIARITVMEDQRDYKRVLKEYGFTEEGARLQTENKVDQIPFPEGSYSVGVFDSKIEGKGLFATGNISEGDIIAPASVYGKRTPAGRYTNHAKNPNAIMKSLFGRIYLVALRDIEGCKGGMVGEEITIDYRESFKLIGVEKCQQS